MPVEVRSLSIIQLKNGIDKYWRKTATKYVDKDWMRQPLRQKANIDKSAMKKDEKDQIKTRALEAGVVEPVHLLALQNAIMIAKIMRYEYPQDWYASVYEMLYKFSC